MRSRYLAPARNHTLTTDGFLQAVYLRGLTQTMDKRQGYARDATTVRRSSRQAPVIATFSGPRCSPPNPVPRRLLRRIPDARCADICVFSVAVVSAKKKTYFELFCIPVFPMASKHVWVCGICQWRVPLQQGYVFTSLPPPPSLALSNL
jgi:hypothetical protein